MDSRGSPLVLHVHPITMRCKIFRNKLFFKSTHLLPLLQVNESDCPEPHFWEQACEQSSALSGLEQRRGSNEREGIVSTFMWHSGLEFKGERSPQVTGVRR